jgi:hypothetical protein
LARSPISLSVDVIRDICIASLVAYAADRAAPDHQVLAARTDAFSPSIGFFKVLSMMTLYPDGRDRCHKFTKALT